jgi:hypothetical protein
VEKEPWVCSLSFIPELAKLEGQKVSQPEDKEVGAGVLSGAPIKGS